MADSIKVPEGYSCVRIVYSGGTVVVVEMIEKSTNIHYTGKIVQCLTQNDIDQFNKEAGRLKTFDHPRIIKLKEVIAINDIKVMVMELGGRPLSEVVQDYTKRQALMPREEVYQVMEDISSALELMHNHEGGRTAHGNIRIPNILIGRDGHAKLCGFGETYSEDMSLTEFEMPQLYVSPERLNSESGEATCEADVWSLGVVLYWLLFGEPPFKATKMLQLIRDIASFKAISIPNSCGEEERALLMRMMDPCAESRITCRQLRLSKSFQCIVNTIEGVWKLRNDEQALRVEAEEEKKKAEAERVRIEVEKKRAEQQTRKVEKEKRKAEAGRAKMEEEKRKSEREKEQMEEKKGQVEREKMKLSDEVKRTLQELEDAREAKEMSERENKSLKTQNDDLKLLMAHFPTCPGTESLKTLDSTAHKLTPTTLTQIIDLEKSTDWRTAFTFPIDEGEWELKIKTIEHPVVKVSVFFSLLICSVLGFLRHPLPENATLKQCGARKSGIGGDFTLWSGGMWKGGELKPPGTNKKCDRIGQTAAIRVNMSTREASLFVDDEEQPGIFTDIPSPLCLGITTHDHHTTIEVLHLATTALLETQHGMEALARSTRMKALEEENLKLEEKIERMRMMLRTDWVGTESLQTFDQTAHRLTPTTLTQIITIEKGWRTAFTLPIDEGEWELKIRGNDTILNVGVFFSLLILSVIGFLRHPLPDNATQHDCGYYSSGIGGDFVLWDGGMWKGGKEFKPEGTNKKWDRVGQTAAIRVNMSTREARLFVDDSEQPGIFTDIPSPICLGITTYDQNVSVEVLRLVRTDGLKTEHAKWTLSILAHVRELEIAEQKMERMRMMLRTDWIGTESLKTINRTAHRLTPTTLTQIIKLEPNEWRTALTFPFDEGEWELKIRRTEQTGLTLGFITHPLPENATLRQCGTYFGGIGGHYSLYSGGTWKAGGEFKPPGTNKKCDRAGQTAAIRVNMRTREARLFVDDLEQPGIFPDIPSPLCFGISTHDQNKPIEAMWLKRI
ncbi:putative Protein kinase domain containing protein [Blattamonas nauphoetae]|uniref:Protein kinase domain-containing protein n=1 Tax=Blattamonas nauphoetae TaxID=2049346 RepID=A0ABQ9X8C2_9EUKA|nr:putative Protein kinase domain containing protein [Blattamonas nauphoetae]